MVKISDKFRQTFPIALTFSEGELPSKDKLQSIASQARNGQGVIQFALGDLWNQSGDSLLTTGDVTDNALMIPNLARYSGPTKMTSPRIPYLDQITEYTYTFSADAGLHEALLTFPPAGAPNYTWGGTAAGVVDAVPKGSKGLVVAAGNWYIDDTTGLCYFFDAIGAGWTLTYKPTVEGDLGQQQTYNIIPDMDTDTGYAFLGLKVAYKNGVDNSEGYYIWLPPRGPLDTRATTRAPQDAVSANFTLTPDALPVTFWQSDNVAATTGTYAEHYRYTLPNVITGISSWGQGAALPRGLLYLWDHSGTGTIIEGVTFFADDIASPTTYKFIARGANLDTYLSASTAYPASYLTDTTTHTATQYPSNGLRLITVGSDLSSFVSRLMESYLQHDHGSSSSMPSKPIQHAKLKNLFGDDGSTPFLDPSKLSYDDHPQYLHRGGFAGTTTRDRFQNAMLGHMVIGSTDSANNYLNLNADSYRLYFGQTDTNACGMIRMDSGYKRLVLHGRTASGAGVLIGDPGVDNNSALDIAANNGSYYIRPYHDYSGDNLYIDASDVYIATDDRSESWVIGRNHVAPSAMYGYLRAGGHIDIAAGDDNLPSVFYYDESITMRAENAIDIRAGNSPDPTGGVANGDDIVVSAGRSVYTYAGSNTVMSAGDHRIKNTGGRTRTVALSVGDPDYFTSDGDGLEGWADGQNVNILDYRDDDNAYIDTYLSETEHPDEHVFYMDCNRGPTFWLKYLRLPWASYTICDMAVRVRAAAGGAGNRVDSFNMEFGLGWTGSFGGASDMEYETRLYYFSGLTRYDTYDIPDWWQWVRRYGNMNNTIMTVNNGRSTGTAFLHDNAFFSFYMNDNYTNNAGGKPDFYIGPSFLLYIKVNEF